ncbi:chloride channel protein [Azospirillum sp. sgz302134]
MTGIRGAASDVASAIAGERPLVGLSRQSVRNSTLAVLLLAGAIGAGIGLAVALLHETVAWAQTVAFGLPEGSSLATVVEADPWRAVLVPIVGGLVLGLLVKLVRRWRPSDIVDPIEANALYGGKMSLIDSLRLTLSTMLSNGFGASVGMEAAYTQAGSGVASVLGQHLHLRRADLRTMVGCGAAAAIAAAYDAPLAGAFYAFELVLGGYTTATLAPVGAAAVVAAAVANWLTGGSIPLHVDRPVAIEGWDYLACGILGFLAGWLSILTMQSVTVAERAFRALPVPAWARPALGGLCVGGLALSMPQVLGAGPGANPAQVAGGLEIMAVLLAAKILASAVSLGSGFRGGLFSASLLLGGLFGGVAFGVVDGLAPVLGLDRMLLVLVGMGSVAAGIIGAPVTMVMLVLEATQDFWAASGVLIGVVVSTTVVRQVFGYSFATWRFHLRGVPIRGAYDIGWVSELTALRLKRADAKTILTTQTVETLRRLYPLGSAKMVFAVEPSGRYAGIIDMGAVHDPSLDEETLAQPVTALAQRADAFLLPGDDVRTVLQRFCDAEVEALPVLTSATDRRIVGYVTEAYALRRYSQELERQRGEELGERSLYGND